MHLSQEWNGNKCVNFSTLSAAVILPVISYHTREKAQAATQCQLTCGGVKEDCVKLIEGRTVRD